MELSYLFLAVLSGVTGVLTRSLYPPCQEQRVIFTEEPQDVEVVCEVESSITFPCQYEGTTISPYWLLNSSLYPSSNPELPEDHSYNNNMLLVTNLDKKNGTTYQCIVLHQENGNICGYLSTAGRLTISCKDFYVKSLPVYLYESRALIEINTTIITKINSSESTLIINYIDAGTGRSCNLTTIATSSFIGGVYKHIFPVSSSTCTDNPDINVTVSTGSDVHNIIDSVKIDAANNFVQVSLSPMLDQQFGFRCTFINQPEDARERGCGVEAKPNCNKFNLTFHAESSTIDSASTAVIVLYQDITFNEICFVVTAHDDSKSVKVKGKYVSPGSVSALKMAANLMYCIVFSGLIITNVFL